MCHSLWRSMTSTKVKCITKRNAIYLNIKWRIKLNQKCSIQVCWMHKSSSRRINNFCFNWIYSLLFNVCFHGVSNLFFSFFLPSAVPLLVKDTLRHVFATDIHINDLTLIQNVICSTYDSIGAGLVRFGMVVMYEHERGFACNANFSNEYVWHLSCLELGTSFIIENNFSYLRRATSDAVLSVRSLSYVQLFFVRDMVSNKNKNKNFCMFI